MNTLGIIIARAGSAGLPNKHLLPLLGRPIIRYTFDHARLSRRMTGVVVSSDCPEIRKLAAQSGLSTIARPLELAAADSTVQDVMLHAMSVVEAVGKFQADALVVLYGNCPIRPRGAIDRAIDMLEKTGCDSVRTFCPVGKWHPAWMSRLDGDRVIPLRPGSIHRRQDLEPLLLHDGAVVAVSRKAMLAAAAHRDDPHAFFGVDRRGFEVEAGATIEIDQLRDLYWAEAVLRESSEPLRKAS
jgi:CMP-N-acetylneuraminic acid synthetase